MTDTAIPDTDEPTREVDPNAVAITINGRPVVARKGELIIAAASEIGRGDARADRGA